MEDLRVLILPPTRRDGEATLRLLQRARLEARVATDSAELATQIRVGAGAVLLTDAMLTDPGAGEIIASLEAQPAWSDIPFILLGRTDALSPKAAEVFGSLTNVTLLDRPTSTRILMSAIQASLRSRTRQYQTRDQLTALRNAQDALRTADRRKDEFLAMLAHELRNPLSPLQTVSELLDRMLPADLNARDVVAILQRQVKQLTRLVDELLDVSRITQNRIQLRRRPVVIDDIVAHAAESVASLINEKQHKLRIRIDGKQLHVEADAARLVQCLANILTNAAKYTDPGGEIDLHVRQELREAVVTVSDNGIGIPSELIPHVFDLFVQGDRSLDRAQGGLGIGLSIVKRLIEMHDGTVVATSRGSGHGSTFEFRLPLSESPPAAEPEPVIIAIEPRRILIVDDNRDAADSLGELLRLDGHDVHVAYTAASALQIASLRDITVVLLDIGLPDMDGFEVARRLRIGTDFRFLIAVTGYGQEEDIRRSSAAGFDAHLVKPVDIEMIQRLLANDALTQRQ